MRWIWTDQQEPPLDEHVIGLLLHRFVNADWRWSEPYVYYGRRTDYIKPTVWMQIAPPTIPKSEARARSKAIGFREAKIKARIADLEAELFKS